MVVDCLLLDVDILGDFFMDVLDICVGCLSSILLLIKLGTEKGLFIRVFFDNLVNLLLVLIFSCLFDSSRNDVAVLDFIGLLTCSSINGILVKAVNRLRFIICCIL